MEKRVEFIDTLKGIGIIFVILGHLPVFPVLNKYIYSFHMPLFFFISGIFINENINFTAFSRRKLNSLMLPYFIISFISYIIWFLERPYYPSYRGVDPIVPLGGIFYASKYNWQWLVHNTPLWFLPALFIYSVLFFGLLKLVKDRKRRFLVLFIVAVIGLFTKNIEIFTMLPYSLGEIFLYLPFIGAGYLLKDIILSFSVNAKIFTLAVSAGILAFLLDNYYLLGFAGIFLWLNISKIMPNIPFIINLGKNSLWVFSFHFIVINLVTGIFYAFKYPVSKNYEKLISLNPDANIILVCSIYFLAVLLTYIVAKWAIVKIRLKINSGSEAICGISS